MAIDSTELSFIRCPSCRSLVSALSKTCRMCGATLSAGTATKNDPAPEKETRARQATYSDGGELSKTAQQLRQETTTIDAEPKGDISPDDPLSAFVTEVEEMIPVPDENPADVEHEEIVAEEPEPTDEDDFEIDEDGMVILKEKDDHHAAKGIDAAKKEEKVTFSSKSPMLSPWPAEGMKAAVQSRPAPAPVSSAPKVQTSPPPPPPKRQEPEDDFSQEEYVAEPVVAPKPKVVPPSPPKVAVAPPSVAVTPPKPSPVPEKPKAAKVKEVAKTEGQERALCGWFVDLSKLGGVGIELREGRFFITQQQLKELDLVIDDDSVSTPHAFMSVSVTKGIKIHDLSSEHGVFVCRHTTSEFEQVVEAVELTHGDRVRFGSVEFVLCLIARQ